MATYKYWEPITVSNVGTYFTVTYPYPNPPTTIYEDIYPNGRTLLSSNDEWTPELESSRGQYFLLNTTHIVLKQACKLRVVGVKCAGYSDSSISYSTGDSGTGRFEFTKSYSQGASFDITTFKYWDLPSQIIGHIYFAVETEGQQSEEEIWDPHHNAYIGVNDKAKRVLSNYIGVNNIARKITKMYIGINNVAQLIDNRWMRIHQASNISVIGDSYSCSTWPVKAAAIVGSTCINNDLTKSSINYGSYAPRSQMTAMGNNVYSWTYGSGTSNINTVSVLSSSLTTSYVNVTLTGESYQTQSSYSPTYSRSSACTGTHVILGPGQASYNSGAPQEWQLGSYVGIVNSNLTTSFIGHTSIGYRANAPLCGINNEVWIPGGGNRNGSYYKMYNDVVRINDSLTQTTSGVALSYYGYPEFCFANNKNVFIGWDNYRGNSSQGDLSKTKNIEVYNANLTRVGIISSPFIFNSGSSTTNTTPRRPSPIRAGAFYDYLLLAGGYEAYTIEGDYGPETKYRQSDKNIYCYDNYLTRTIVGTIPEYPTAPSSVVCNKGIVKAGDNIIIQSSKGSYSAVLKLE